jgi:hypothetical protein
VNLYLKPGINYGAVSFNSSYNKSIEFENKSSLKIGLQAEYILPFNKSKWAVSLEPSYQSYHADYEFEAFWSMDEVKVVIDYESIELPVGIRHYFFLNQYSKLYLDFGFIIDYPVNSGIYDTEKTIYDIEIQSGVNMYAGAGYQFKSRYCFELRHGANRELTKHNLSIGSMYKTFSVVFGYRIF